MSYTLRCLCVRQYPGYIRQVETNILNVVVFVAVIYQLALGQPIQTSRSEVKGQIDIIKLLFFRLLSQMFYRWPQLGGGVSDRRTYRRVLTRWQQDLFYFLLFSYALMHTSEDCQAF